MQTHTDSIWPTSESSETTVDNGAGLVYGAFDRGGRALHCHTVQVGHCLNSDAVYVGADIAATCWRDSPGVGQPGNCVHVGQRD